MSGAPHPVVMAKSDMKEETRTHSTAFSDSGGTEHQQKTQPEGGWGWVVCIVSLMAHGTSFGVLISFGIIYTFIVNSPELSENDSLVAFKTSWIGSLSLCIAFLTNIFSGFLCDRFGIRQTAVFGSLLGSVGLVISAFVTKLELLYLTYSLLVGFGAGCIISPSVVILGHYFKDRIGLVSGIASCGTSVYTFPLSFALPKLLDTVNLKFTFIALAGLYFLMALGALTWIPILKSNESKETQSECTRCKSWKSCLKSETFGNRQFVIWIFSVDLVMCGVNVLVIHVIKHAQDLYPDADEFLLYTVLQLGSGISRPIFGKVSDLRCVNPVHLHQFVFFIYGVLHIVLPFIPSYVGLVTITSLLGVFNGGIFALIPINIFNLVGTSSAASGLGLVFASAAIPSTIGPPFAGFLYDKFGTYTGGFIGAGCVSILGSLLIFAIQPIRQEYQLDVECSKQ